MGLHLGIKLNKELLLSLFDGSLINQIESTTPLNIRVINHTLSNQIFNVMVSKLVELQNFNFVITINPNSPKHKLKHC